MNYSVAIAKLMAARAIMGIRFSLIEEYNGRIKIGLNSDSHTTVTDHFLSKDEINHLIGELNEATAEVRKAWADKFTGLSMKNLGLGEENVSKSS